MTTLAEARGIIDRIAGLSLINAREATTLRDVVAMVERVQELPAEWQVDADRKWPATLYIKGYRQGRIDCVNEIFAALTPDPKP